MQEPRDHGIEDGIEGDIVGALEVGHLA